MSIFKTLVARTNPTKMLTRGFSLGHNITPYSQFQNRSSRYFSIQSWREKIIESYRSTLTAYDNYSVPPDLQGNINDFGEHGKVLPKELLRTVVKLSCESSAEGGICDVYLVGTCHMSEKSPQEVKAIIGILKPQVVFLELCKCRLGMLFHKELKVPTVRDLVTIWWKSKRPLLEIFAYWYPRKLAYQLGVPYGMEFNVAYEEARKLGSKVVLGDRPFEITKQRFLKEISQLAERDELFQKIKELLQSDPSDIYGNFQKMDRMGFRATGDERDQYMSAALLKVAREHNSVVAVVGILHLEGIKRYWKQPTEFEILDVQYFKVKRDTVIMGIVNASSHSTL